MKDKINLYWYRHKEGKGNFGDELNPYIVRKLTGAEVSHVEVNYLFDDKWLAVKTMVKALMSKQLRLGNFMKYLYYNFIDTPQVLLAIGSILESSKSSKNLIWGAGFIHSSTNKVKGKFLAVRGYRTKEKLVKIDVEAPEEMGDPALLLPLIYKPSSKKTNKIGIIPHYQHYQRFKAKFGDEFVVIDLLDDIEKVIDLIHSCQITLSTSLHGIIVSHCYGIPSIWSEFHELTSHKLAGDNMKFYDYFSSVDIPDYEPVAFDDIASLRSTAALELFNDKLNGLTLPAKDILKIRQHSLFTSAPFKIRDGILAPHLQPSVSKYEEIGT